VGTPSLLLQVEAATQEGQRQPLPHWIEAVAATQVQMVTKGDTNFVAGGLPQVSLRTEKASLAQS